MDFFRASIAKLFCLQALMSDIKWSRLIALATSAGLYPAGVRCFLMQIDDLRDYLDILEEYQEVQRIDTEVDWNLEMGAITRRVYDLGAPAALF
jgi:hypothetical protein